jgi:glycosyltransferase involved in cell wall biosynthesis
MKGKVAILTVLASIDAAYSVAGVTLAYLRLLREKGHDVVLVTTSDFKDHGQLPAGVEVRTYTRYNRASKEPFDKESFDKYVETSSQELVIALEDCSVCLTQDIIFIHEFLCVNWAMRVAAESLPHLRWIHWMHSGPSQRPRKLEYPIAACFNGMINSRYVCVNRTDIPKASAMYAVPESHVRTVHNFVDPVHFFDLHPLATEFYHRYKLYEADTICVYPTRLVEPKQVDKVIKLLAQIKATGQSVRLFVCNSYSNAEKEKTLAQKLSEYATGEGFSSDEVIITSLVKSPWAEENDHNIELGIPNSAIRSLMQLADLFVLPSISEACSMIMLEAGMTKNLIVLNRDLLTTTEFLGQELEPEYTKRGLALSFGSVTRPVMGYLPDEASWYADRAKGIMASQDRNQAIQFFKYVRKYHSPTWVYENQLMPLISPDSDAGNILFPAREHMSTVCEDPDAKGALGPKIDIEAKTNQCHLMIKKNGEKKKEKSHSSISLD